MVRWTLVGRAMARPSGPSVSTAERIEARIDAAGTRVELMSALRDAHEAMLDHALSVTEAAAIAARGERKSRQLLARLRLRRK